MDVMVMPASTRGPARNSLASSRQDEIYAVTSRDLGRGSPSRNRHRFLRAPRVRGRARQADHVHRDHVDPPITSARNDPAFKRIAALGTKAAAAVYDAPRDQDGATVTGSVGRLALRAPIARMFGHRSVGAQIRTAAAFQLLDWELGRPESDTTLMVGPLRGLEHVMGWANVRVPPVGGTGHVFVPAQRLDLPDVGIIVAIPAAAGARLALRWPAPIADLDRLWISRVVAAISFVVGVPLSVPFFVGYDRHGRQDSARGSFFGVQREFASLPGSPSPRAGAAWLTPFLGRLLVLLKDRPDVPELDLALQYYVDSYDDPLDAAYLKLVVVLEGIAQRVLMERGTVVGVLTVNNKLSLVRDQRAWRAFAEELEKSAEFVGWRALVQSKAKDILELTAPAASGENRWARSIVERLAPTKLVGADELSAGQRVLERRIIRMPCDHAASASWSCSRLRFAA